MDNEHEHRMRVWEKSFEGQLVSFQGVISFATLSIKSLLLFNGGAILALLTFYGNVLTHPDSTLIDASMLGQSVKSFVIGVIAGLVCSMSAYITQATYLEVEDEQKGKLWANWLRLLAVVLATNRLVRF